METMDSKSNNEKELKRKNWLEVPKMARQAFIAEITMIPITIAISFTGLWIAKILSVIFLTIILSIAICAGIVGIILGSMSLKEQRTAYGIIGLIIGVIITLYNAFLMFILHCDAWFSVPP